MTELPNECWCEEFSVVPKDWNLPGAYKTDTWYITYKFYDPLFASQYPKGKTITITKGLNKKGTLEAKRQAVKAVMKTTLEKLKRGYNPITKTTLSKNQYYNIPAKELPAIATKAQTSFTLYNDSQQIDITPELIKVAYKVAKDKEYEMYTLPKKNQSLKIITLHPEMSFVDAMWGAFSQMTGVDNHLNDVRSCIRAMHRAAFILNYHQAAVSKITAQVLLHCFQVISRLNPKFSDNRKNRYKAYLSIMFSKLLIPGAVFQNVAQIIPVINTYEPDRPVPDEEEVIRIDNHLKHTDYYYWRFICIFFSSGSRQTELARVKYRDVNLEKQEFKVHVRKGRKRRNKPFYIKPIPIAALHFWQDVMKDCESFAASVGLLDKLHDVVLFSEGIKPAFHSIRADQYGRRWNRLVKKELGINKDLYKLKHLYSDLLAKNYSVKHAQVQNSHESEKTTRIYTVKEEERRNEELKRATITLLPEAKVPKADKFTPLETRITDLDALWSVQKDAVAIFRKFINLLKKRNNVLFNPSSSFSLNVVRSKNCIGTSEGPAALYRLDQGVRFRKSWTVALGMEFLYISPHYDNRHQISYDEMLYPVCLQQDMVCTTEYSITLKDDKVYNLNPALAAAHKELAEKWLPVLESQYLVPAYLQSETITFKK